jgi:hypothetical protein
LAETLVGWAIEPVNASDLEKIRSIKAEFHSALPAIRVLCERALHENLQDGEVVRYLLSGIAASIENSKKGFSDRVLRWTWPH